VQVGVAVRSSAGGVGVSASVGSVDMTGCVAEGGSPQILSTASGTGRMHTKYMVLSQHLCDYFVSRACSAHNYHVTTHCGWLVSAI
jgi:hypothetical protein